MESHFIVPVYSQILCKDKVTSVHHPIVWVLVTSITG